MLDTLPSYEEIKNIIFQMNPESSAGPDSFSGIFYRTCWEIICTDLVAAIQFCWKRRFIPRGLNSNFLVLLPKCQGAKKANQFRPIGLSNVLFKIFTKIITVRMNSLLVKLIPPQKAAYNKGRSIREQILLASETVNEVKRKRRGGNVAFKLDIYQAYDSLWLMVDRGFFSMERGLKQGDPLSALLFVLMEDVLSRNISQLVNQDKKSLNSLFTLPDEYQASSGQLINKDKRVILAPGRVTSAMIWHVVEMIQHRLAKWKGRLLSFAERLVLFKSVLCSIPLYNMTVYRLPASVIKIFEKLIRNFLWPGNSEVRKFKTLSWKKVCTPYNEGGLGIRRLEIIKKAFIMKIMWKMVNSQGQWALFFAAKLKNKQGQWFEKWKPSSVYSGLKWAWSSLKDDIKWNVGDGAGITVWFDSWYETYPMINEIGYSDIVKNNLHMEVKDMIKGNQWEIPIELQSVFLIRNLPAIDGGADNITWNGSTNGYLLHQWQ
ncbi:uncharacterized protein LOC113324763 [Papaver somniferum]|uniref:uncharacterized protein LOC113324763 n=1 Tax=Papaver somniferum TaxID=3469 RepID=UPI000E703CD6|nr:uncharacterized protein LOC113324763 [Papaver somniferum]